jgi:Trk K+ transport system NAD-binding subunit
MATGQEARVKASFPVAGTAHVVVEVHAAAGGALAGKTIGELEAARGIRVLARAGQLPRPDEVVAAGDLLTVHTRADRADELG